MNLYWITNTEDDYGFLAVAETSKEAKKLSTDTASNEMDMEYTDIRVRRIAQNVSYDKGVYLNIGNPAWTSKYYCTAELNGRQCVCDICKANRIEEDSHV